MSKRYGITRFALLNTAGYALGLFPLDAPLSIYASNNIGKSAAINALQFPFLTRLPDMRFGKYTVEKSLPFYFGSDTSYILVEVELPHGPHVIGVVGKGPAGAYGHTFFAYAGELELDHYRSESRGGATACLRMKELFPRLEQAGLTPIELRAEELRRLLTGGNTQHNLDLTLIPLRNANEHHLRTFRALFVNLLHMKDITSGRLKELLLDVFDYSLRSSSIDYIAACDDAFRQVRRMEQEYHALKGAATEIEQLRLVNLERHQLAGMLRRLDPLIDGLVEQWHDHHAEQAAQLKGQSEELEAQRETLSRESRDTIEQARTLANQRRDLEQWLSGYRALERNFALVDDTAVLEENVAHLKQNYGRLMGMINAAEESDLRELEQRMKEERSGLGALERQLERLDNNLYSRLREEFSEDDLTNLRRLLNSSLFSLSIASGQKELVIDDEKALVAQVGALIKRIKKGVFHGDGYRVELAALHLAEHSHIQDRVSLTERIARKRRDLERVEMAYQIGSDIGAKRIEAEQIAEQLRGAEQSLRDYRRFHAQREEVEEREQRLAQVSEQDAILSERIESLGPRMNAIAEQLQQRQRQLQQLAARHQQVQNEVQRRRPLAADLPPGNPYEAPVDLSLDNCAALLAQFNEAHNRLMALGQTQHLLYANIRSRGVSKFESLEREEERIHALLNAFDNLDAEELAIRKAKRAAVTDIARTLRNLRDDFDRLQVELEQFNRTINRRRVSNLEGFSITLVPNQLALGHIDQIIRSADSYAPGENLSVFDLQDTDSTQTDEKTDAAKEYLGQMVQQRGNQLGLKDLFELAFEISKNGHTTRHTEIDGVASNGTTITIKALTNMYLIRHMLDDREADRYRWPFYLDEAADVDERNQAALIDASQSLGFMPVLASVKPQTTAHYAIDLESGVGKEGIFINELDWKMIERIEQVTRSDD